MKRIIYSASLLILLSGCSKEADLLKLNGPSLQVNRNIASPIHSPDLKGDIHNAFKAFNTYREERKVYSAEAISSFYFGQYNYRIAYPFDESLLKKDYAKVLNLIEVSAGAKAILKAIENTIQSLEDHRDPMVFKKELQSIRQMAVEMKIHPQELNCINLMCEVAVQTLDELLGNGQEVSGLQTFGLGKILRKIGAVICAVGAATTVAAWHYVLGSPYNHLVNETARWSYIVGYYTGWWPEDSW